MNVEVQNTVVQEKLVETIDKVVTSINDVGSFVLSELPDVVQQLIQWTIFKNSLTILFAVTLLLTVCLGLPTALKSLKQKFDCDSFWELPDDTCVASAIAVSAILVLTVITVITSCFAIVELVQLYVAPKVWLIEYANNLRK